MDSIIPLLKEYEANGEIEVIFGNILTELFKNEYLPANPYPFVLLKMQNVELSCNLKNSKPFFNIQKEQFNIEEGETQFQIVQSHNFNFYGLPPIISLISSQHLNFLRSLIHPLIAPVSNEYQQKLNVIPCFTGKTCFYGNLWSLLDQIDISINLLSLNIDKKNALSLFSSQIFNQIKLLIESPPHIFEKFEIEIDCGPTYKPEQKEQKDTENLSNNPKSHKPGILRTNKYYLNDIISQSPQLLIAIENALVYHGRLILSVFLFLPYYISEYAPNGFIYTQFVFNCHLQIEDESISLAHFPAETLFNSVFFNSQQAESYMQSCNPFDLDFPLMELKLITEEYQHRILQILKTNDLRNISYLILWQTFYQINEINNKELIQNELYQINNSFFSYFQILSKLIYNLLMSLQLINSQFLPSYQQALLSHKELIQQNHQMALTVSDDHMTEHLGIRNKLCYLNELFQSSETLDLSHIKILKPLFNIAETLSISLHNSSLKLCSSLQSQISIIKEKYRYEPLIFEKFHDPIVFPLSYISSKYLQKRAIPSECAKQAMILHYIMETKIDQCLNESLSELYNHALLPNPFPFLCQIIKNQFFQYEIQQFSSDLTINRDNLSIFRQLYHTYQLINSPQTIPTITKDITSFKKQFSKSLLFTPRPSTLQNNSSQSQTLFISPYGISGIKLQEIKFHWFKINTLPNNYSQNVKGYYGKRYALIVANTSIISSILHSFPLNFLLPIPSIQNMEIFLSVSLFGDIQCLDSIIDGFPTTIYLHYCFYIISNNYEQALSVYSNHIFNITMNTSNEKCFFNGLQINRQYFNLSNIKNQKDEIIKAIYETLLHQLSVILCGYVDINHILVPFQIHFSLFHRCISDVVTTLSPMDLSRHIFEDIFISSSECDLFYSFSNITEDIDIDSIYFQNYCKYLKNQSLLFKQNQDLISSFLMIAKYDLIHYTFYLSSPHGQFYLNRLMETRGYLLLVCSSWFSFYHHLNSLVKLIHLQNNNRDLPITPQSLVYHFEILRQIAHNLVLKDNFVFHSGLIQYILTRFESIHNHIIRRKGIEFEMINELELIFGNIEVVLCSVSYALPLMNQQNLLNQWKTETKQFNN